MSDYTFSLYQKITAQTNSKRKTADLDLLREWAIAQANDLEARRARDWPNNKDRVKPASDELLHLFGGYGGFQNRSWECFVSLPKWYEIVKALQAYDDTHKTHHYWNLLYLLNWSRFAFRSPKWYMGSKERFTPLPHEIRHARAIHDGYVKALGL